MLLAAAILYYGHTAQPQCFLAGAWGHAAAHADAATSWLPFLAALQF